MIIWAHTPKNQTTLERLLQTTPNAQKTKQKPPKASIFFPYLYWLIEDFSGENTRESREIGTRLYIPFSLS